MHEIYIIVTGPALWLTFIVFAGGSLYKLIRMLVLVRRKEPFVFSYLSFKYGLRSILYWMTPFATVNMRQNPVMTVAAFTFHICLFLTPVFLLAHNVLLNEAFGVSLWTLPDSLADVLTVIIFFCCLFFLFRRLFVPEVRFVTSGSDYLLLGLVTLPFVTGFFAYHQWFYYQLFLICHIISGELLLMAIPFTRLSHMLFAVFTRAYIGSEFGGIRHARDW